MLLNVIVDDQSLDLNVPPGLLEQAEDFFAAMDRDMDSGWQMSREWVQHPDPLQRCQIAADKLLTALETENRKLALMMAGYILSRLPNIASVDVDTAGDISATRFVFADPAQAEPPAQPGHGPINGTLNKMEALAQAAQDVTKVFKTGRSFGFSIFDHSSGTWVNSTSGADKQQAEELRQQAFKRRFDELVREDAND